eukprot:605034-Rhodomonas_salina.5
MHRGFARCARWVCRLCILHVVGAVPLGMHVATCARADVRCGGTSGWRVSSRECPTTCLDGPSLGFCSLRSVLTRLSFSRVFCLRVEDPDPRKVDQPRSRSDERPVWSAGTRQQKNMSPSSSRCVKPY